MGGTPRRTRPAARPAVPRLDLGNVRDGAQEKKKQNKKHEQAWGRVADCIGIRAEHVERYSFIIEEALAAPLPDPWQSFAEPQTGHTFYFDSEYDVSTYDHPMVYECIAWETSSGQKFSGCTTEDTQVHLHASAHMRACARASALDTRK